MRKLNDNQPSDPLPLRTFLFLYHLHNFSFRNYNIWRVPEIRKWQFPKEMSFLTLLDPYLMDGNCRFMQQFGQKKKSRRKILMDPPFIPPSFFGKKSLRAHWIGPPTPYMTSRNFFSGDPCFISAWSSLMGVAKNTPKCASLVSIFPSYPPKCVLWLGSVKPIGNDPEHDRMKRWKCPQYYVERGCRRTGYVVPAVGWFYRFIGFNEQNIFMPRCGWPKCTKFFYMQLVHGPNISTKFHQNRSTSLGELAHVSLHGCQRWTPSPRDLAALAALDRPETGYWAQSGWARRSFVSNSARMGITEARGSAWE